MSDMLRKHLMVFLLVSIPALALTDVRPWTVANLDFGDVVSPSVDRATIVDPVDSVHRLPSVALADEEWLKRLQVELQQLGATYVRLEKWDSARPVYEFRCDLRRADSGRRQTIEILSGSPRAAGEQVLNRARIWYGRTDDEVQSALTTKPEARRRPTTYLSPHAINWQ